MRLRPLDESKTVNPLLVTMRKLWLILCAFCALRLTLSEYLYNESESYAGLASAIADYHKSACIYLLTDSRSKDARFVEKVMKLVTHKHKWSANVYSFDEYHSLQESDIKTVKCYVPLQVVISHDDATHQAFVEHSKRTSMHGSDSYGGGIWLVFVKSLSADYMNNYFSDINTPFDVQLLVAELKHNLQMVLKEVYRLTPQKPLRTPMFGSWSVNSSLQAPPLGHLYSRRNDLEGEQLRVGYVNSPPFTYHVEDATRLDGYLGDIWEVIQSAINITSSFRKKKNYGVHLANGSWTGLIRAVHKEEFDVGIADFALTQKRYLTIDYSLPLMLTTFQVIYKNLGSTIDADAMFMPLGHDLWVTLACWILLAAVLLYLGCYLSDVTFDTRENMSFATAMFFVSGALCGQAGFCVPQRFTCRTLFLSSFFVTAVVIPSYSASLMSYLTILPPIVPFQNMKEFYESGKFKMVVKYSSYEFDLFAYEASNDPFMHQIFKRDLDKLGKEDFPRSTAEAMDRICKHGDLAYFGLNEAIDWAFSQVKRKEGLRRNCNLRKMSFDAGKVSVGIIFPKKSHFRGIINYYLYLLLSRGTFKRLIRKHWPLQKSIKLDEVQPVELSNVFMMFVVVGLGVVAAVVLFIAELHFGRKRVKIKRPNSDAEGEVITPKFHLETLLENAERKMFFQAVRRRDVADGVLLYKY